MYEVIDGGIFAKIGLVKEGMGRAMGGRTAYFQALESRVLFNAYFVSAALGSDSGTGAADSPFQTIQRAAAIVKAGDVVTVEAGTYAGFSLGWSGPQNGTAQNPITFVGQSGAVIDSANSRTADGIDLEGASYVDVEGFTITNPLGSISRAGIRAVTDTNVTIQNNNVNGCGDWGIFTGFSENVTIQNNTASNSITQHGIYVSNSADNPIIRGNVVYGNHDGGIQLNGDITEGGDGIISNALIEDNIIYDNGVGGGSAINLDGVQNGVIRNNLLYNNYASGISLFRDNGGGPSSGNLVVDNTIVQAANARWAINIVNGSVNNTVYDNILDNQNAGKGAINISADSLSGFVSDYNLIINDRFSDNDGSSATTLAGWQAATGQDAHSQVSTELLTFVDSASNNYQLGADSPAIGAGTGTDAPATDIEGNPRGLTGTYDIGAYAFVGQVPPALVMNSTTTTLTSSVNSAVYGQTVSFAVTVASSGTIPTGTVTLMDGSTALGSCSLDFAGDASFTTADLSVGGHNITAIYSGDACSSASGSAATAIMITAPLPPDPAPIAGASTPVSFNGHFNTTGIYNDGSTFYKRAGLDGVGDAYSANLLGNSITANGTTFNLRAGNMTNVLSANGQTIKLPAGQFSQLAFLGAAVAGSQTGTFTVTYTDGTTQTFTQTFSDWSASAAAPGETLAKSMSAYDLYSGQTIQRTTNVYAYAFMLDNTKTVRSITLPKNMNIKLLAMDVIA